MKVIKKKITEDQAQNEKRRQRKTTFEPAAAVGGTSTNSIYMFYTCHQEPAWCLATLSAVSVLLQV